MALILANGYYLRVTNVDLSRKLVYTEIYKDETMRERVKTNRGDSRFDHPFSESEYVAENLDVAMALPIDTAKTLQENLVTVGYTALKALAKYAGAEDC